MFKKLLAGFVVCASMLVLSNIALAANTMQYKEGTHYLVRGKTPTPKKEIREFFSFWCGHCFHMQNSFKKVKEQIPEAEFIPNPVMMLGGFMGPESQKAVVVAENFGLRDEFIDRLFKMMHEDGKIPMSTSDLADFATTIGIPRNKFLSEIGSFPVLGKVAQFDKKADEAEIDAVPELLVNGRYLVIMDDIENDEQLVDLVRFLVHLDDPVATIDPSGKSAR